MTTGPKCNPELLPVPSQQPCLHAAFQEAVDNTLLAVSAVDIRGEFFALDSANIRPRFIEIIHSRPGVVRGNHLHRRCTETLTVLSGAIDLYLLCDCVGRHLFRRRMNAGVSVQLSPGVGHAVYTLSETEIVSIFADGDPRQDRERIAIIS